ncbi:RIKEN cDNA 2410015M20, isoform CRA_b, partial [Mus musculus]
MVARVWSLMRFLIKGSVAGGAVYLVYDQELLGPSDKSEAALRKAEEVVPPAMYQFSQYVCQQTGLEMPQLPTPPKIKFPKPENTPRRAGSTSRNTASNGCHLPQHYGGQDQDGRDI